MEPRFANGWVGWTASAEGVTVYAKTQGEALGRLRDATRKSTERALTEKGLLPQADVADDPDEPRDSAG